jgi:hypothetical protein
VRALKHRVENCKNLQQRKKDNTDPIVNPAYFIKNGPEAATVTIDGYCRKVLKDNRPKSGVVPQVGRSSQQGFRAVTGLQQQAVQEPPSQMFGGVPNLARQRPQSANPNGRAQEMGSDLPGCSFKEILHHIVDHKLFRDVELKVLYVRLCHRFGEENIDELWEDLMDELER